MRDLSLGLLSSHHGICWRHGWANWSRGGYGFLNSPL